jgi:hypothetical protein
MAGVPIRDVDDSRLKTAWADDSLMFATLT